MFYPKTIRFLIFCFIAIGTETKEDSDDHPTYPAERIDDDRPIISKSNAIEAIQDEKGDISENNSSPIPKHIDNEQTAICENNTNATTAIKVETSEDSDEEWLSVDGKIYDHFQKKLNRFFSRRYSHGHYYYPRNYRHWPQFYQQYPRGYRCKLIEYLGYQHSAVGILFKVCGIFGIKNSTTIEKTNLLVLQDTRRNILWTWP